MRSRARGRPQPPIIVSSLSQFPSSRCHSRPKCHQAFHPAFVRAPVTPFAIERAVAFDYIVDYATALAVRTAGKRYGDHAAVNDPNAVRLVTGAPAKLIDIAMRNNFQRAFVTATVRVR